MATHISTTPTEKSKPSTKTARLLGVPKEYLLKPPTDPFKGLFFFYQPNQHNNARRKKQFIGENKYAN